MKRSVSLVFRRWAIVVSGLTSALPSFAQYTSDIDIYSSAGSGSVSNVLFVLDSSANWNAQLTHNCVYRDGGAPSKGQTKGGMEQCALYNVIDSLKIADDGSALFNIGFMVFNETNVNTGARVIQALTPLTTDGKQTLKNLLKRLDQNQSPAPTSYALAMHEAYLYFSQKSPFSGQRQGTFPYDRNAFSGSQYTLPLGSDCGKNYIIFIANGPPQDDYIKDDVMKSMLAAAGGSTVPISYSSGLVDTKDAANWTDEYARFINGINRTSTATGAFATTYAIAVTGASSDKATYPAIFKGIAEVGGGDFKEAQNSDTLTIALGNMFSQMQAVNSVFSSASLPVSVNSRGTFLNQVFIGMFRPDGDSKPRWRGNLKQYKFKYEVTTDSIALADADGNDAISGTTGFLKPEAVSYWTQPTTFWTNQQLGTPASVSDSPDGEVVEKGGVAQAIRNAYGSSQSGRNLYTCVSCTANTNLAISSNAAVSIANSSSLTAISNDAAERNLIINWLRGTDNAGDERGPGSPTTIRPSVHGDVLHSRPAVVNYGTEKNPNIVVFYGANDGLLRAVNGNQSGSGAGQELWGFIPEEHFPKLKRLRSNSPEVRLSTTAVLSGDTNPPRLKDYFVDGPISVYQKVAANGSNSKVYLYSAMRRGGRFLYALDVTNPAQPAFLWKKSHTDIGFEVLGQTWSEPRIAKLKGQTDPVIVMGAGYDASAEDVAAPGTTTMGNAVMVLNALTGAKLAQFNTDRSVAADVTLVDSDYDGYVDRAYAVDLGGNIYRIDFETTSSTSVSNWGMYKLAALKGMGTRKFFYPPDVVLTKTFTAVQVGSGDREKPLQKVTNDAFFTVFDDTLGKGTLTDFTAVTPSNLGVVGTAANMTNGCYIPMNTAGEKVVNAPLSFRGVTYFGTNRPTPSGSICSANLGEAKTYSVPQFCRAPSSDVLKGGGLPPSPVAGFVTVTYEQTVGGEMTTISKQKEFVIGAPNPKHSAIEVGKTNSPLNVPRKRRYWYQENKPRVQTP